MIPDCSRRKLTGTLKKPSFDGETDVPIRHIRVLYALPNAKYDSCLSNITTAPYEFFCRYGSLGSHNPPGFWEFLSKMIPGAQFYTCPKET